MSEDEDDYLSDKFLLGATAPGGTTAKTYTQRRKEAQRLASLRNEQNKKKSRRELELESREEGLSTSLFERAQEDAAESGTQNKALAMMMKMGFKPGQSLGRTEEGELPAAADPPPAEPLLQQQDTSEVSQDDSDKAGNKAKSRHRAAPLPLQEWAGKKGIGLGKRAASPNAAERLAKMAKMAENREHSSFRDRARQEYEERRAEGRLVSAQRTCTTLDEKDGREFNVLWLNPNDPESFPEGLLGALDDPTVVVSTRRKPDDTYQDQLRAQMRADALRPLGGLEDDEESSAKEKAVLKEAPYSEEDIKEAIQFLRLGAKDRLDLVLEYLRRRYVYCFWCGTQYRDEEDMGTNCPGPDKDDHD